MARRVRFGIDVSEHQDGLSLVRAAAEGIEFAVVRATDGTYRDSTYRSHVDDAFNADLPTTAYHYLRNPSEGTTVKQQVAVCVEVMGGAGGEYVRPVWLDCETPAGLGIHDIRAARDAFVSYGVPVAGVYTYARYWRRHLLSADTSEFGELWLAHHGQDPVGTPSRIFPGADNWPHPLGMRKPAMWQFGSNATVAGFNVDINARLD